MLTTATCIQAFLHCLRMRKHNSAVTGRSLDPWEKKTEKRVFTSHEPQWGSLPLPQWLMVIWEISFLAFLFSIGVSKLHSKIHKNAT